MGSSSSWARDQEEEELANSRKAQADELRATILSKWGDWSLKKMEMVEILADLDQDDEKTMCILMENYHNMQIYLKMQGLILRGELK